MSQKLLFAGLDCCPGQLDLFGTDGDKETRDASNHTQTAAARDQVHQVRQAAQAGLVLLHPEVQAGLAVRH